MHAWYGPGEVVQYLIAKQENMSTQNLVSERQYLAGEKLIVEHWPSSVVRPQRGH